MIRKLGKRYVVLPETTGRGFGAYWTLAGAKERLRQAESFGRLSRSPAMRKNIRKKSLLK